MSWWDTSWQYRKKLTFDNSGQAENLVNFPVLVHLDTSNFDFSKAKSAGADLRFVDSDDSTALKYAIEKWVDSTEAWIWVKVPQVDASSSTDFIYMYYGNSGASDAQDAANVWDANHKAVYHLHGTSGLEYDSTNNNNNGTVNGATRGQTGKIDNAFSFDGVDDYVSLASAPMSGEGTSITVELWIRPNALNINNFLLNMSASNKGFSIRVDDVDNSKLEFYIGDGSAYHLCTKTHGMTTGQWFYVVGRYDHVNMEILVNGSSIGSQADVFTPNWESTTSLISISIASRVFNGLIDEVRISNIARSVNWIKAQYLSMTLAFITFGSEDANFIKTEAGAGVEIAALISLLSGDGGSGGDALKSLIETAGSGSDMRLPGRQGQVRIPSKGVNL